MLKYIYIGLLILFCTKVNAQFNDAFAVNNQPTHYYKHYNRNDPKYYILLSPYISDLFYKNYSGDLFASFPYQVKNESTGIITNQLFSAHQSNPFLKNHFNAGGELEVGRKFYVNVKVGGMGYMANTEGSLGVGYNLFFNKSKRYRYEDNNGKYFLLKLSLSLAENTFTDHFGSIDNEDKDIYVFGDVAHAVVPVKTRHHYYSKTTNYNARILNVDYEQTIYSCVPQISFGNNPFKGWFHFQVDVGWLLPFFQTGGLSLEQELNGSGASKLLEKQNNFYPHYYTSQTNGLTLQYNNNSITKTPFDFGGPIIKFSIGINLGHFLK